MFSSVDFSAAGGAQQHDQFAGIKVEIHPIERTDIHFACDIHLGQPARRK